MPHDLLLNVTFQLPHLFPLLRSLVQTSTASRCSFLPCHPNTIYPVFCLFFISFFNTFYFFVEHLFSHRKIYTVSCIYSTWHMIFFCSSRIFLCILEQSFNKCPQKNAGDFHFSQSMGIVCLISATKWSKPVINIYI